MTVVEKADAVRGGGYAVDIRGTAREVVDRMGLLPELRKAHVDSQKVSFVEPDGSLIATIRPEAMTGGAEGLDLEVRRGDLADALYTPIRDKVEFIFSDSIAQLDDRGDRVDVVFDSGTSRTFDLVIGADGLHSNTRRLVFGPEEDYHRYVGYAFAGFTLPNDFGLSHEGVVWNVPGRAAVLYAHEPDEPVHGFLTFQQDVPPYDAFRDPAAQRDLVTQKFPHRRLARFRAWSRRCARPRTSSSTSSARSTCPLGPGRVALAGDAAHATSFMSGQGSSVSLVGAYVLAGELATHANHTEAFTAYDHRIRSFVEQNQALVEIGRRVLAPTTQELLDTRNQALRGAKVSGEQGRAANTGLVLPDYY